MSVNDPFFDAWVRDMLRQAETHPPEHLWDAIRRDSRFYMVTERRKYLLVLLLLLLVTGSLAWWGIHPLVRHTGETTLGVVEQQTMRAAAVQAPQRIASAAMHGTATAMHGTATATHGTVAATEGTVAATHGTVVAAAMTSMTQTTSPMMTASVPPTAIPADLKPAFPGAALTLQPTAVPLQSSARPLISVRPRRQTYIELYAGPDHATHYISTTNPAYKSYVQATKGTVMPYPSFSLGVNIDMPLFSDRWRFQTGLHYFQINEQLHYFNPSATKTVAQVTTRSVVQPSGRVVQVQDTTQVTYTGSYLKQSLNAYRGLDVPLIVSRTLVGGPQFQVDGSVGTFINLASWYTGDILDTTIQPTTLHRGGTASATSWKKNIGASLYGSLSVRDQLTSRIQVSLEPYIRYELGTINKDVGVYKEKFVTTGLALGIRYALGK